MSYTLNWQVDITEDDAPLYFGAGRGRTPEEALQALSGYLVERRLKENLSQEWIDSEKAKLDSAIDFVRLA
jgi:hypothetical protein